MKNKTSPEVFQKSPTYCQTELENLNVRNPPCYGISRERFDALPKKYRKVNKDGNGSIQWHLVLAQLRDNASIPMKSLEDSHLTLAFSAKRAAGSWVTCACGNTCSVIPRHLKSGEPINRSLASRGVCFSKDLSDVCSAFNSRRPIKERKKIVNKAIRTLNEIEEISTGILNKMAARRKK